MQGIRERRIEDQRRAFVDQLNDTTPDFVKAFEVAFKEDLDGDPAVQVEIVIADGEVERPEFKSHLGDARDWIEKALTETGIDRWPYMTFRAESEVGR